jgi:hypothetical protein
VGLKRESAVNRILLLGAGFSFNWGGRLAAEVRSDLQTALHGDQYLSRLVQQRDFESVLGMLQGEYDRQPNAENEQRLRKMQSAVSEVFGEMNRIFMARPGMEFGNDIAFSIRRYLTKFDAIFSLNQDLLIEFKHRPADPGIWHGSAFPLGYQIPGMKEIRPPDAPMEMDRIRSKWVPRTQLQIEPNLQPFFKLHGSSQWETGEAMPMLVIGSAKAAAINRLDVLRWYWQQFLRYLSLPDTRLVVIGYGFADDHINRAILDAAARGTLSMFVVDPRGRDVLVKHGGAAIPPPEPLRDDIPSLGESRRSLSTTFLNDQLQRDALYRAIAVTPPR